VGASKAKMPDLDDVDSGWEDEEDDEDAVDSGWEDAEAAEGPPPAGMTPEEREARSARVEKRKERLRAKATGEGGAAQGAGVRSRGEAEEEPSQGGERPVEEDAPSPRTDRGRGRRRGGVTAPGQAGACHEPYGAGPRLATAWLPSW